MTEIVENYHFSSFFNLFWSYNCKQKDWYEVWECNRASYNIFWQSWLLNHFLEQNTSKNSCFSLFIGYFSPLPRRVGNRNWYFKKLHKNTYFLMVFWKWTVWRLRVILDIKNLKWEFKHEETDRFFFFFFCE